jgi:hypothetical protein
MGVTEQTRLVTNLLVVIAIKLHFNQANEDRKEELFVPIYDDMKNS